MYERNPNRFRIYDSIANSVMSDIIDFVNFNE